MPHFVCEYSSNLDDHVDFGRLVRLVRDAILRSGLFELGAVRVRAVRCNDYVVADDLPENAFLDMSFRLGAGRSADEKKAVGEAIFACVSQELAPLLAEPHFAMSLEIREIDPALSWKANAIHPRLR